MGDNISADETPVVVGTAGHVDHGKSALVLALTGTDPDRLPQEKARGITIDLGFAALALPSGRTVGLVDVPGHEHYVRAMVAGAMGVDVALLVVAADDGVMPQTREHVRILELVGVRHMVVALTKCDAVDAEWAELVQADVEDFLAGTAFAGSPVVACSARTGEGIDDVARAVDAAVDAVIADGVVERRRALPARLSVDRSFNVAGFGAVVTGTLAAGSVAAGDALEVMPAGLRAKVRGVQVHDTEVPCAVAGQRTAINLAGVELADVPRGSTLGAPGTLAAYDRFDASIRWLGRDGKEAPLISGERVHVCVGTTEALGRILLFGGVDTLAAGEEALCQIRLEEPLVVRAHDCFVAMAYSPVELVGGGEVLLTGVARRTNPTQAEVALIEAQARGDVSAAVEAYLSVAGAPCMSGAIADALDVSQGQVTDALAGLVAGERVLELPCGPEAACFTTPAALDELVERIGRVLDDSTANEAEGLPAHTLLDRVCPRVSAEVFSAVVDAAVARGVAARFGANVASAGAVAGLQARLDELARTMFDALEARGVAAPFADELAGELGLNVEDALRGLRELAGKGQAVRIDKNHYLAASAYDELLERVRSVFAEKASATTSELREAMGLSRKYAVPLLEYLDKERITARDPQDPNNRRLV